MKQKHTKYTQINSKIGPFAQPHNTIQHRTVPSYNLPSFLQTSIIAEMLSIGGDKGAANVIT